ncbi:MAG: hypothetical protein ABR910_12575, partial [Acidobacteriaceae bacterium]
MMHTGCISLSGAQEDPALPDSTPTWKSPTPNVVRGHILFAFGVALALALAWHLQDTLTLVYVSALFAVVLSPVVNRIMRL